MKGLGFGLIIFGIIIIAFPAILVFLIGGFFIFLGINLLTIFGIFNKSKQSREDYVKFGNYKIYREKK